MLGVHEAGVCLHPRVHAHLIASGARVLLSGLSQHLLQLRLLRVLVHLPHLRLVGHHALCRLHVAHPVLLRVAVLRVPRVLHGGLHVLGHGGVRLHGAGLLTQDLRVPCRLRPVSRGVLGRRP